MVLRSGYIHNQLSLVVYPIIYKVLYIPGGCLGFLNHQQYHLAKPNGACDDVCSSSLLGKGVVQPKVS